MVSHWCHVTRMTLRFSDTRRSSIYATCGIAEMYLTRVSQVLDSVFQIISQILTSTLIKSEPLSSIQINLAFQSHASGAGVISAAIVSAAIASASTTSACMYFATTAGSINVSFGPVVTVIPYFVLAGIVIVAAVIGI
jgi:hypothetical protein